MIKDSYDDTTQDHLYLLTHSSRLKLFLCCDCQLRRVFRYSCLSLYIVMVYVWISVIADCDWLKP